MPPKPSVVAGVFALALGVAFSLSWRGQPQVVPEPIAQVASVPVPPLSNERLVASSGPVRRAALKFLEGVCPPVRGRVPQRCEVLTDLYCRLDRPEYWRDHSEPNDLVTFAHEMAHGASNRLGASNKSHGLYLGNGQGIVLTHPKVTIAQVAAQVPRQERGKVFDLYMVKQAKQWNDSPIYILDECVAYYTGCVAHKQLGMGRHRSETFEFARELQRYSEYLVKTVQSADPQYPEMATLAAFVEWQGERLDALGEPPR
jgi:hypothetical protein